MRLSIAHAVRTRRATAPPIVAARPAGTRAINPITIYEIHNRIRETGAEIEVEPLPTVEGDASQLRQVLQNLLDNAVTYGGDDPPRVRVASEQRGGEWVLSVEDERIGIDPVEQDQIFTAFERLHGREEYDGTGIGLALCQPSSSAAAAISARTRSRVRDRRSRSPCRSPRIGGGDA